MKVRLLLFAKAPVAGQAKTRLIPALGAAGASALAAQMLEHALSEALAAQVGAVELCVSPAIESQDWAGFTVPAGVEVTPQGSGDLGARMARAVLRTLRQGEAALLLGSDCPALNAQRLRCAAAELSHHHAVIHPAVDGGYTLLGLRQFHASLFNDIPWGGDQVAAITLHRLAALAWQTAILDTLPDIDRPADLCSLPAGWITDLP